MQDGQHRVIIGSIPIFDSRKDDGITRIIIDHHQPTHPQAPPPDYEQYLRSRQAKRSATQASNVQHHRPYSEYIDDEMTMASRYESSSLPRKAGKGSRREHEDAIMAVPPARDVHYFYHPHQQLK